MGHTPKRLLSENAVLMPARVFEVVTEPGRQLLAQQSKITDTLSGDWPCSMNHHPVSAIRG